MPNKNTTIFINERNQIESFLQSRSVSAFDYVNKSDKDEFIIGTEQGIIHELEKKNPNKKFYLLNKCLVCKFMKLISLEDVYNCLKDEKFEITVDENIRKDAQKALDKMLELS